MITSAATAIWERAKENLYSIVGERVYESWFSGLELSDSGDDTMLLSAEGEFAAIWIRDNYMDVLANQISLAAGRNVKVEIAAREESRKRESARIPAEKAPVRPSAAAPKAPAAVPPSINPRNTFESFVVGESNRTYGWRSTRSLYTGLPASAKRTLCTPSPTSCSKTTRPRR